jgi:hypothetical protein
MHWFDRKHILFFVLGNVDTRCELCVALNNELEIQDLGERARSTVAYVFGA